MFNANPKPLSVSFLATASALLVAWLPVANAQIDLSDVPLASASTTSVKPNILYVLDDSGSMQLKFMPDGLSNRENRIGMRNYRCNQVYYNPGVRYVTPKASDGSDINSASPTSFTAAYNEGFWDFDGSSSSTTNLSTGFRAHTDDNLSYSTDKNDAAQPAYYWEYLGTQTLVPLTGDCEKTLNMTTSNDGTTDSTSTGYCVDDPAIAGTVADYRVTSTPPVCSTAGSKLLWKKVIVGTTSGDNGSGIGRADLDGDGDTDAADRDERQNFANWYSYYRNRMKMMKSASGRAFVQLNDGYRIGFITINPNSPVTSSKFLTVADFDSTQKASWFDKLYSQESNGSTPLRQALSRAGRYFAGMTNGINSGMSGDPMQYSCQQNFSILTTDGYWNSSGGEKIDGTTDMDNQDGVISELDAYRPSGSKYYMSPRPIFDGSSQTYGWYTASNQYRNVSCVYGTQPQQRTVQYQICSATTNGLLTRTSTNAGASWSAWTTNPTGICESDNVGQIRRQCSGGTITAKRQIYDATNTSETATYDPWVATGSCSEDSSGGNRRECRRQSALSCSGTWSNAQCTNTDPYTSPLCRSNAGSWANVTSCTPAGQDGSGVATECQTVNINGYKTEYLPTITSTTYVGPGGPSGGTQILSGPTPDTGSWTELDGTCHASAPTLPTNGPVSGASTTPLPPGSCTDWPCEIITSGGGGVSASVSNITAATDTEGNCILTATTSSAHSFVVGHSVSLSGLSYGYNNFREIIEVPDNTHFKYYESAIAPCTAPGDKSGTAALSGGSSNSLADVAQYYYKTDLRGSGTGPCTGALGGTIDVCENNVPASGSGEEDDRVNWQHMTTFTLGLGLTGTVTYSPTYLADSPDNVVTWPATNGQITGRLDFQDIRRGTANWPIPQSDSATALDDLWHAAVNGRGEYFSASDPDSVINGLTNALSGISARLASAAAAATSNLEPVAGDNFAYTAQYVTQKWIGELEAHEIDLDTGTVLSDVVWSASAKLSALTKNVCDNRNIKLFRAGATDNLIDFKWNTSACDTGGNPTGSPVTTLNSAEQAHFTVSGTDTYGQTTDEIALFSQYSNMSASQKVDAAGANLVNFLRGQRSKEGFDSGPPATNGTSDTNKLYRARDAVLGDIINAQPIYVRAPFAEYIDATNPGYAAFKSAKQNRTPMVYVAANDGMLHAFYAGTSVVDTQGGTEAWSFIPTMALPNLYKLASENYANQHTFTVDGTPVAADVFDKGASADCAAPVPADPGLCWKTIMVGGLNKGGEGYYALDITDPANPKGLWEFKRGSTCISVNATTKVPTADAYDDCHLGYSYNKPVIGKLSDGTWVALVTSGYNNDDGIGYLYVLDAVSGKILYRIDTGSGTPTDQSGLSHLSAWVNNAALDNMIVRVYGVDLLGNIWRFDINDNFGTSGREAMLVAQVVDDNGTPQPITTKPELAEIDSKPYVYVATGRYLGSTDLADTQKQTVWAIRDKLETTPTTNLRITLGERIINNVGSGTSAYRTVTTTSCDTGDGWFADLPDSGERVNIDIKLQLGTLIVASNVPSSSACTIGGYGWLNFFNYRSGCAVANSENDSVGVRLVGASGTESLAVGTNIVRLPNGKTVVIVTTSAAEQLTLQAPFDVPPPVGKRVSWREIVR
ncbi:MAG: PilC/PilY family type IV pilus protein [Rhodocyclaceae bacterium]|jgi:type IV pilus assembly protein PilY1|nr:PilC/PilY family type IV pilus protein [Rhodocyclaceae bacterium]